MIFEAIAAVIAAFFELVLSVLPPLPDISGLSASLSAGVATLTGWASTTSSWVPWGFMGQCVTLVLTVFVAALVIRVVRIVVSLFTGGGGAGA